MKYGAANSIILMMLITIISKQFNSFIFFNGMIFFVGGSFLWWLFARKNPTIIKAIFVGFFTGYLFPCVSFAIMSAFDDKLNFLNILLKPLTLGFFTIFLGWFLIIVSIITAVIMKQILESDNLTTAKKTD